MKENPFSKAELKSSQTRQQQEAFLASRYGIKLVRHKCCCPFHEETTPSFSSWVDKLGVVRFHCFGCQIDEDIFGIMRRMEPALSFGDALSLFLRYVTQSTQGGYNDIARNEGN